MVRTTQVRRKSAEYGSDVVVDLLKAYGFKYIALNPGSSFRGIHDSLVNYGGNTDPAVITCLNEEVAVSMAHGYAKATGMPMAAIVHNVVGLQHATMAIYNAWCDRVPLVVLGGNGPLDTTKRRHTDWAHSALAPGNLVRDFVKWDDQPYSVASIPESFARAYKMAMTPPRGPVYICYDASLQDEKLSGPLAAVDVTRYSPPVPIPPNQDALRQAAQWLVGAERPVIIADYMCRNKQAAGSLIELAELLSIPVAESGFLRVNFPTGHPLNVAGAEAEILEQADVVLLLDTADALGNLSLRDVTPGRSRDFFPPATRVIRISLAELLVGSWAGDYGRLQATDLDIFADTSLAIPQLVALCRKLKEKDGSRQNKYRERFDRIRSLHDRLRVGWVEKSAKQRDEVPISVSRLSADVWEVIKSEDWVLVNSKVRSWQPRLWDWTGASQWLGHSGGGGLGYGIGASLGAALAYKGTGKLCVDIESDGEFLYNPSALWTAAHHQVPLLVIVFNNRAYFSSERHCRETARARGRLEENGAIGNRIGQPPVDFAKLAQSLGVYGEGPIEKPEQLKPALRRALKVVMGKKSPALVDVIAQSR